MQNAVLEGLTLYTVIDITHRHPGGILCILCRKNKPRLSVATHIRFSHICLMFVYVPQYVVGGLEGDVFTCKLISVRGHNASWGIKFVLLLGVPILNINSSPPSVCSMSAYCVIIIHVFMVTKPSV